MKKLLFAVYIVVVVAASLAARAGEIVYMHDSQIQLDSERQTLQVVARFPNICINNAHIVLSQSEEPGVLYVDFAAHREPGFCASVVGLYQRDFSVRGLKFELQRLNESPEGTYMLVSRNGQFQEVIDFSKYNFASPMPHPEATELIDAYGLAGREYEGPDLVITEVGGFTNEQTGFEIDPTAL